MRYTLDTVYSELAPTVTASSDSTSVSLADGVSWYQVNAAVNTTVSFGTNALTYMSISRPVVMFYLLIQMPSTVTTVSWPSSVRWLNNITPIMNAGGKTYILQFCSFNQGTIWIGSKVGSFTTPS